MGEDIQGRILEELARRNSTAADLRQTLSASWFQLRAPLEELVAAKEVERYRDHYRVGHTPPPYTYRLAAGQSAGPLTPKEVLAALHNTEWQTVDAVASTLGRPAEQVLAVLRQLVADGMAVDHISGASVLRYYRLGTLGATVARGSAAVASEPAPGTKPYACIPCEHGHCVSCCPARHRQMEAERDEWKATAGRAGRDRDLYWSMIGEKERERDEAHAKGNRDRIERDEARDELVQWKAKAAEYASSNCRRDGEPATVGGWRELLAQVEARAKHSEEAALMNSASLDEVRADRAEWQAKAAEWQERAEKSEADGTPTWHELYDNASSEREATRLRLEEAIAERDAAFTARNEERAGRVANGLALEKALADCEEMRGLLDVEARAKVYAASSDAPLLPLGRTVKQDLGADDPSYPDDPITLKWSRSSVVLRDHDSAILLPREACLALPALLAEAVAGAWGPEEVSGE